ncbi:hypothetical protein BTO20_34390 [Mycobacterium dioxanotrophicus]|uniref:Uncharacterized protein n=1 Tax=Mycobacterium dioxanotrophicus TaxID=482462 RepID=A0A1Y0CCG8_9MYCO|nr:hypothetical protein [Mycobacterium dioxanotrophicus]ART72969.1 hypothetical protein BTO20_34390 [Mycobacterium dioxanotrophicus]
MSTTTEFAELHKLIGDMRRSVTALAAKYGDSPATRRITNDVERILLDVDRLNIDADELAMRHGCTPQTSVGEKIAIPDTQYDREFWGDISDGGVSG